MRIKMTFTLTALLFAAACGGGGGSPAVDAVDSPGSDQPKDTGSETTIDPGKETGDLPDAVDLPDPGDVQADEAPADVPPDIHPTEDVVTPTEDVTDPGPDAPPIQSAMFRFSQLAVNKPVFCFPGVEPCNDVSSVVNEYVKKSMTDTENPVNILLSFNPMDISAEKATLQMGSGVCQFAGVEPVACGFSKVEKPIVFSGPIFHESGSCETGVDAPCFITEKAALELIFLSMFMSFQEGYLSGRFQGGAIDAGHINAFIPVNTTKAIQISLPGSGEFTLYDFLKPNPVEDLNGVKGFRFDFSFSAKPVDMLDVIP